MTARSSCFRATCAADCCAFDGWSTRFVETRAKAQSVDWKCNGVGVGDAVPRAVSYRAIKDLVTPPGLYTQVEQYPLCGTVTTMNGDMMT